jgi:uncharacterized protein YutD
MNNIDMEEVKSLITRVELQEALLKIAEQEKLIEQLKECSDKHYQYYTDVLKEYNHLVTKFNMLGHRCRHTGGLFGRGGVLGTGYVFG